MKLNNISEFISKVNIFVLIQVAETIKFQYTNWSNVEDQEMMFKQALSLIGDYQYNCPGRVVNLGSDTFGNHIFQNVLQN